MDRVTIKDVAREAGVSISTVSNALNGVDVLHPDTKAHILGVAERLHYIPNLNGRNLKANASKTIGFFVPYVGGPYVGALADNMARECSQAGYELDIFVTSNNESIMKNLLGRRVDGAILLNSTLTESQEWEIRAAGIPLVYLNKRISGTNQAGVYFDSFQAGKMAADLFIRRGFQSIGLIEGPDNFDARERSMGFRKVLKEKGILLDDRFIWQGGFSREKSFDFTEQYLQQQKKSGKVHLPEAIFATNDLSAIGCMEALEQHDIKVPEMVRILGCDDIELCRYMKPSLSTIKTNFEEQGIVAMKCLLKMLYGDKQGEERCLNCRIIVRESI